MAKMTCPRCDETVDAKRLNWNDITDQRYSGTWDSDELQMGPHQITNDPALRPSREFLARHAQRDPNVVADSRDVAWRAR